MSRILLRFNTKYKEDPEGRTWRVLVDGTETLAHKIVTTIPCETIQEPVEGVEKHHFLCWGKVDWTEGDVAWILPEEKIEDQA